MTVDVNTDRAGDEADAYLVRYGRDGDLDLLTRAVNGFESALRAAPDHDEALWWRHRLGLSYAERADRTGSAAGAAGAAGAVADYDRAIGHLETVVAALPPGHPDRDLDLVLLIDAYWDRYRRIRYAGPCPPEVALAEAERCVAALDTLVPEVSEPEAAAYARVVHGQGLLARYDETGDRGHLDAGVDALAAALDEVGPQTPRYVHASADLSDAYRQRAHLDEDPTGLSSAVDAGQRGVDTADPDDPTLPLLLDVLAQAYRDRWDIDADPGDLDHTIDLLERAVVRGDDAWYELARAHHERWKVSRTPGSLERATDCLDRVLATDPPSGDDLLFVHNERLAVTRSRLEYESECTPSAAPPSAPLMRRHVAEAREAWERAGADASPDLHAMLATMLALSEVFGAADDPDSIDIERVTSLVAIGRTLRNGPPEWPAVLAGADALVEYALAAQHGGHRDGGLGSLVRGINDPGADAGLRGMLWQLMPMVLMGRAVRSGDRRTFRAAIDQLRAAAGDDPDAGLMGEVLALLERAQRGDFTVAVEVRRLAERLRADPPSFAVRQSALPLLSMMESALGGMDGRPWEVDRTPLAPGAGLGAVWAVAGALFAVVGPLSAAATRHDVPALRECAARIAEIAAVAPDDHVLGVIVAGLGGMAELEVVRNDRGDRAAARRAAAWWAEAATQAGGPDHPLWSRIALSHGEALRLAGDLAGDSAGSAARRLGLSALRGFGWQVLLQSGTDDATVAAADAASAALKVAAWCRADRAYDDLVAALDAGRGLVLSAATTSRTVAEQLTDAGRPDLAEQWRESAGLGRDALTGGLLGMLATGTEVPGDLRMRVLRVLGADDPVHGGAFTPVRPAEIRAALAALGADALVYLVPATAEQSGAAVVVAASAGIDTVVLPDLMVGPHTVVGRHAAGSARDAGPAQDDTPGAPTLDDVCRWAWSAAIGELLRYTGRWGLDRPVRLVLVPMGLLGTVPWHAAFRQDAHGRHYAIERAVFSYTVSARTLCTTARLPVREIRSALVVGNPNGDLPFAGLEAAAISRAFYPDGVYLDRPTPDQVLDWIAAAAPGPSLLHLACHGRVDPAKPADAHLVLAGGTLTARRLLDASRVAELVIERVFLAACTTGVTGADHDEAFSLSTAFLAAGARTVFGSLWSVPDTETSLLMYLVHHFLNEESCAPVDALHRAQLWMLDQNRRPPAGMPPELASHCRGGRVAEPASWAAFTHQGR